MLENNITKNWRINSLWLTKILDLTWSHLWRRSWRLLLLSMKVLCRNTIQFWQASFITQNSWLTRNTNRFINVARMDKPTFLSLLDLFALRCILGRPSIYHTPEPVLPVATTLWHPVSCVLVHLYPCLRLNTLLRCSLSCWSPPATSLALHLSGVPSGCSFCFKNILLRITLDRWSAGSQWACTGANTFITMSWLSSRLIAAAVRSPSVRIASLREMLSTWSPLFSTVSLCFIGIPEWNRSSMRDPCPYTVSICSDWSGRGTSTRSLSPGSNWSGVCSGVFTPPSL